MMARQPHVILAAGGTGGHVFPAEALAVELIGRGARLGVVTDRRGGAFGGRLGTVEAHRIRAGAVAGRSVVQLLRSGTELALGLWQARRLLRHLQPDVVVGFGGYASVPTMLAAAFGGFRTVLHEQNAVLGRANRLLASRVARIATSFASVRGLPEEAAGKVIHTGMPVRPAVADVRGRSYSPLTDDGPVRLLVLGGSQGAQVFSAVVPAALSAFPDDLRGRLRVAQQCRPEDLDGAAAAYRAAGIDADLATFFDDVPARMAEAHLLIARAGASTVAELTTVGRPAILVPYPHAADDHQTDNAQAVDNVGAGWLMPQEAFTAASLAARLQALIAQPTTLATAAACAHAAGRPDAAARLADAVWGLLPQGIGDTEGAAP